jgi:hypothetical protein
VARVRRGDYVSALLCPAARALLLGADTAAVAAAFAADTTTAAAAANSGGGDATLWAATGEAAAARFAAVEAAVEAAGAAADAAGGVEPAAHELVVLAVGVAALNAFTQANVTGPDLRGAPPCPCLPSHMETASRVTEAESDQGPSMNADAVEV